MAIKRLNIRQARLSSEITKIIALSLESEFKSAIDGMISISSVYLSSDLKTAKVFYTFIGENLSIKRVETFFSKYGKKIRSIVAHKLSIRSVPELVFVFDNSSEKAIRIESILHSIQTNITNDLSNQ